MSDIERWKPVVGFEGDYEVSDQGRVRSVTRVIQRRNGSGYRLDSRILRPSSNRQGYQGVGLFRGGKGHTRKVHRLVLEAFVGLRPDGEECCHADGDPSNNALSNLRWGTSSENKEDKRRHGTLTRDQCRMGHDYSPGNTRITVKGTRLCRKCLSDGAKRRYWAKRAALIGEKISGEESSTPTG